MAELPAHTGPPQSSEVILISVPAISQPVGFSPATSPRTSSLPSSPVSTSTIPPRVATSAVSKRVTLNVGGIRYETMSTNFLKYPDSTLGRMFAPENSSLNPPDDKGEYFIDRNGKLFEHILDFYRTGAIYLPPNVSVNAVREEVSFFQLPIAPEHITAVDSLGERIKGESLGAALSAEPIVRHMKKLAETLEVALSDAAEHGCYVCKIDIMKSSAFIRASRGAIMSMEHSTINPNVVDDKKPTGKWHHNLIDKDLTAFLAHPYHQRILDAFMTKESLKYTLRADRSFYVLKVKIFECKASPKKKPPEEAQAAAATGES